MRPYTVLLLAAPLFSSIVQAAPQAGFVPLHIVDDIVERDIAPLELKRCDSTKHGRTHSKVFKGKHGMVRKGKNKTAKKSGTETKGAGSEPEAKSKLISVVDKSCGSTGATELITPSSGPNGAERWLNCGLSQARPDSGWTPPNVTLADLKYKDLDSAVEGDTFKACKPFVSDFKKAATKYKIPPILIASIAMQESSCNPQNSGDDGGAFGLMQITGDKCGGAPNGDCSDPTFNIDVGAKTFVDALSDAKGNVLEAFGGYNGWQKGMTYNDVLKMKDGGCCVCMQNVDYLMQMLNGWMQGVDAYSANLGTVRNLNICGNDQ